MPEEKPAELTAVLPPPEQFFDTAADGSWTLSWDPLTRSFTVQFAPNWYDAPSHELVSGAAHLEPGECLPRNEADLRFILLRLRQVARQKKLLTT